MHTTEAWLLCARSDDRLDAPATLVHDTFSFPEITDDEVLVEPLFGCWEGNMTHALTRQPVDVCKLRGESRIVLGNSAVVRVLKPGAKVRSVREGDVCVFTANVTSEDEFGYMVKAHGYDAPNTLGFLAKRTKLHGENLLRIPEGTPYSLEQWAAYSLRYPTAWSNFRVALGALRLQLTEADLPAPYVWGWGGGTTLAELDLARRFGCDVTMISGSDAHIEQIAHLGIRAIDRRKFPNLVIDEKRYVTDADYKKACQRSEDAFLDLVRDVTGEQGVSIFIDYMGSSVTRVTLKALGRQGVLATAGWKLGPVMPLTNRAVACIKRQLFVHTHYARHSEHPVAMSFAARTGWMPEIEPSAVYDWESVPRLAAEFAAGNVASYFPIYRVNTP
jgi:NADPH:quinone reductase-like Zn-dependent oxidoreductase